MAVRSRDDVSFKIGAEDRTKAKFALVEKGLKGLGIAVTAAAAATVALTKAGLENVDSLKKTADKLGVTTQSLAGMRLAAKDTANMAETTFDMALQRMTRRLSEAAQGTGEAQNAIKELGLDAQRLAAMSPDKAMLEIADAMKQVKNQGDRVRLSFKLFDSEGAALANTLKGGSATLLEGAENARKYGLAVDDVMAARVEKAQTALGHMGSAVKGVGNAFAVALAPMITDAANALANLTGEFISFFNLSAEEEIKDIEKEMRELGERINETAARLADKPSLIQGAIAGDVERLKELQQQVASLRAEMVAVKESKAVQTGGEDIATPDETRLAEKMQQQIEQLDMALASEEVRIDMSYQKRSAIVENAYLDGLISAQRNAELLTAIEEDKQNKLVALTQQGQSSRAQFQQLSMGNQVKGFLGFMENMTAGVATSNKEMFELNKVASTANAIMSTYEGANKALAQGGFFGVAKAAIIVATGLANVASIQSSQFGSSTSAPSIGGGGAIPVTPVTPVTSLQTDFQSAPVGSTQEVHVTIEGTAVDNMTPDQLDALAESIGRNVANGGRGI